MAPTDGFEKKGLREKIADKVYDLNEDWGRALDIADDILKLLPPPVETLGKEEIKKELIELNCSCDDYFHISMYVIDRISQVLSGKIEVKEKKEGDIYGFKETLERIANFNNHLIDGKEWMQKQAILVLKNAENNEKDKLDPKLCGDCPIYDVKPKQEPSKEKNQRIEPLEPPEGAYKLDIVVKLNEVIEAINRMGEGK